MQSRLLARPGNYSTGTITGTSTGATTGTITGTIIGTRTGTITTDLNVEYDQVTTISLQTFADLNVDYFEISPKLFIFSAMQR